MALRNILITDTETTGLDPSKDKLIEVGLVLYNLERGAIIHTASLLIDQPTSGLDPDSEKVHGIPLSMLYMGETVARVDRMIGWLANAADAYVAHNADFDRQWIDQDRANQLPWICTCNDITWPKCGESRSLTNIALAHGCGVVDAHRALTDCLTIARLLTRLYDTGTDIEALLAPGLRPKATFIAMAPREQNDLLKEHRFRWNPNARVWWRKMATDDVAALPFKTRPAVDGEVSP
jgi:DNA polymerase-3 subunit epsilon